MSAGPKPRVVPAGQIPLADLWPRLDLNELYKLQWGVRAKGAEYERMIREEFAPKLEELKAEAQAQGWLQPKVVYGYFPCHAAGNELVVLDPQDRKRVLATLSFPRLRYLTQAGGAMAPLQTAIPLRAAGGPSDEELVRAAQQDRDHDRHLRRPMWIQESDDPASTYK